MAELRAKYDCQQDSAKVGESASFLEHLMGNENIPLESIYANTTELLLSGLDTVSNFKVTSDTFSELSPEISNLPLTRTVFLVPSSS